MVEININIKLNDDFFEVDEWDRLQDFFNKEQREDLEDEFEKIILSSLSEYKEMFVGRGFPSRVDEVRQYRLFYLIKHYFKKLPSETEVSGMFQENQTSSKSLIQNVLIRFRFDLRDEIDNALKDTLCSAELKGRDNPEYRVIIESDIIVEEFNRIINKKAPKCKIIKKVPGTGRNYSISEDSYKKLKEFLFTTGCLKELKDTLCSAELKDRDNPEYHVIIESDRIVDEFNRIINKKAPKSELIEEVSDTSRNYSIPSDSYDKLKEFLIPKEED